MHLKLDATKALFSYTQSLYCAFLILCAGCSVTVISRPVSGDDTAGRRDVAETVDYDQWIAEARKGWAKYWHSVSGITLVATSSQFKRSPNSTDDTPIFDRTFELKRSGERLLQDAVSTRYDSDGKSTTTRSVRSVSDDYFFELVAFANATNTNNPQITTVEATDKGASYTVTKSRIAGVLYLLEAPVAFLSDSLTEATEAGRLTLQDMKRRDGPLGGEVVAKFTYERVGAIGDGLPAISIRDGELVFLEEYNWCIRRWRGEVNGGPDVKNMMTINVACDYGKEKTLSVPENLKRVVTTKVDKDTGVALISTFQVESAVLGPISNDAFMISAFGFPESVASEMLARGAGEDEPPRAYSKMWILVIANAVLVIAVLLAMWSRRVRKKGM